MRSLEDKNFGYIYNFWSDGKLSMTGNATGGLSWKAMVNAAPNNPYIAKRVELYKHRVPEEFYDFKKDPNALHNLINDPHYAAVIQKFQIKMLQEMISTKDPA